MTGWERLKMHLPHWLSPRPSEETEALAQRVEAVTAEADRELTRSRAVRQRITLELDLARRRRKQH